MFVNAFRYPKTKRLIVYSVVKDGKSAKNSGTGPVKLLYDKSLK